MIGGYQPQIEVDGKRFTGAAGKRRRSAGSAVGSSGRSPPSQVSTLAIRKNAAPRSSAPRVRHWSNKRDTRCGCSSSSAMRAACATPRP